MVGGTYRLGVVVVGFGSLQVGEEILVPGRWVRGREGSALRHGVRRDGRDAHEEGL